MGSSLVSVPSSHRSFNNKETLPQCPLSVSSTGFKQLRLFFINVGGEIERFIIRTGLNVEFHIFHNILVTHLVHLCGCGSESIMAVYFHTYNLSANHEHASTTAVSSKRVHVILLFPDVHVSVVPPEDSVELQTHHTQLCEASSLERRQTHKQTVSNCGTPHQRVRLRKLLEGLTAVRITSTVAGLQRETPVDPVLNFHDNPKPQAQEAAAVLDVHTNVITTPTENVT